MSPRLLIPRSSILVPSFDYPGPTPASPFTVRSLPWVKTFPKDLTPTLPKWQPLKPTFMTQTHNLFYCGLCSVVRGILGVACDPRLVSYFVLGLFIFDVSKIPIFKIICFSKYLPRMRLLTFWHISCRSRPNQARIACSLFFNRAFHLALRIRGG